MKLVVDTNVVVSAIVKASVARQLLFHPALELYSPAYLFDELEEHRREIMGKAGLDAREFGIFAAALGKVITVLPATAYSQYIDDAKSVIDDPDDLPFAAAAIALTTTAGPLDDADVIGTALHDGIDLAAARVSNVEECGIWSNDPHFTRKEPELY